MLSGADFTMEWREPARTTKTTAHQTSTTAMNIAIRMFREHLRHEYREGFERGYDVGVRHMMGEEYRR